MMTFRCFKALPVILLAAGSAHAADLLETFRLAQANDPVFAAARAARQGGQESLAQGRALLLPSINASAGTGFNDQTSDYKKFSAFTKSITYNNHGYNVSLTQPLFRAQNWISYTEGQLQAVQADAQFRTAEQDLVLRVAQAYFEVLIARDNVQTVQAQKTAISEQLEQAKRHFEVGTATITDTLEAQSRFDLVVAQEVSANSSLEIKRSALQQLIAQMPQELQSLGAGFKLESPEPADMEKWVSESLLHNPQLLVAQLNAELAEKEVKRNKSAHLPTLDLAANYAKDVATDGLSGPSDMLRKNVSVQLSLPLFQGGGINSKVREAEANHERRRQDMENARRTAATQTRQAYLGVVSGIAQIQALQQALASSQSLLEASKLGQEVGIRTNLDVLNAQQQLYTTQRDLYQAEYNYLINHLRLKAAVGELSEDVLAQVNSALH